MKGVKEIDYEKLDQVIHKYIPSGHEIHSTAMLEDSELNELLVYAALFCLEYKIKPGEIDVELRIYQNDEILHHEPTAEDILPVMDAIVQNSRILERIHEEG